MYTVITNTTTDTPTCQNITFPPLLDVVGTVPGGPLSQYGFINQCTDLSVTPKNGKPPFTLTVAPSLHPPYNITSNSMDPIVWTVSLSWAFPFFLSLVSSDGLMWVNGPMHAGGPGTSDCLSPGSVPGSKARGVALGVGFGTLFVGLLMGTLSAFLFFRDRRKNQGVYSSEKSSQSTFSADNNNDDHPLPPLPQGFTLSNALYRTFRRHPGNIVSPYRPPPRLSSREMESGNTPSSPVESQPTSTTTSRLQTYVLHHDGGQAPVTVLTVENNSEVVELPPDYRKVPRS